MRFIQFVLQGPLQSWGERSRWDSRDTATMPTKSGILGMIGCCMGIPRGSEKLYEMDQKLHVAVRADRRGRIMTDFHTVQASKGQKMINAQGKPRGETIITPKQYLQEAQFTVFIWGDEEMMKQVRESMLHPFWVPFLGRKSCVPSVPILPKTVEARNIEEAIIIDGRENALVEIEFLPGDVLRMDERLIQRPDRIVDASRNEYRIRMVRASTLPWREE